MDLSRLYPSMQDTPTAAPAAETLLTDAPKAAADKSTVSRMYPSMPDTPTVAPAAEVKPVAETLLTDAPQAKSAESRAFPSMHEEKPFVDVGAPPEVLALREADSARRMFNAQSTYKNDLSVADFESVEGEGITPEVREQAAATYREIAADLELPAIEVRELAGIFKAPRPSEEAQAANRSAAVKWLTDQHGDRAGFALEAARALIARDPRTAALLDHSGAGDDVRVVQKIVGSALRQLASGKLTMPKKK